ncbi:MAG: amidohydrolase [Oscillospiraceae bacterium]|nr:amidohydrolase [Oscillospiraceae bacterium]
MYEKYLGVIDSRADLFCGVSDALWDHPEAAYKEYFASDLITKTLEENGFTVVRGLSDIPTSFTATYGSGKPHFGILAEYDALEGMSQVGESTKRESIPGKDCGHGCGHNLFAGGSLAAAFAVKAYIEETGRGSVTLFGCPAEEGGGGKIYMARDGLFADIDSVVSWHPERMNMVRTRPALATRHVEYSFVGTASHAGANPQAGRSALDAVELMNVGANFLREHMDLSCRIHYAILDAGGDAPNMVQSHAKVLYYVRATDSVSAQALTERVNKIAQGAALMTETEVSINVLSGYANLITIPTLQATANEAMHDIPLPVPTEEELAFAAEIQKTIELSEEDRAKPMLADTVLDPVPPKPHGGSTDTADVSWCTPTVQMHVANWAVGTPGHSWQSVSQSKWSFAKRMMLWAGKAVAGTIMRLMENPELVEAAKREHAEKTKAGYMCAIPAGAKPNIPPRP